MFDTVLRYVFGDPIYIQNHKNACSPPEVIEKMGYDPLELQQRLSGKYIQRSCLITDGPLDF